MIVEKRKFNRIAYNATGTFTSADIKLEIIIHDLSLKSALFTTKNPIDLAPGTQGQLTIALNADYDIAMDVQVVRQDGCDTAVICKSIDLDSMTHLRNLVELNCADPSLLERDLANLIATK